MKTHRLLRSAPHLLPALLVLVIASARAQTAPAPTADARALAKYDANKNGRLDPDEVSAMQVDEAKAASASGVAAGPATSKPGEETVTLSPFEVKEANNGYYATNTMSGTRLNTKLEDLASSISVVTKAQMQDFAMLDINDIFAYESGTEGTGNYTAFEVDRNGMVSDQVQNNPQGSNRIRGMGAANISLSGFATSGRVPIDPSNIDAVEISRGPNSSIFGLGEGSGTVNLVASSANFSRETTAAEFRLDDIGGWRTSLDLNRPIIKGKLGARVSAVYQHDAYRQKPSGFETRRFNAMLRFQPFKNTTMRGSYSSYHGVGTRANTVTPKDAVTYWKSLGSPVWDPIANAASINGGPFTVLAGTTNPVGLSGQGFGDPILFIDNGIKLWEISRMPVATATNGPNNQGGTARLLESVPDPVRNGRPLFSTLAGISDRNLFDYSSINLAGPNTIKDQVETTTIELEQYILNTDRNKLAFQFAWQREDADRINRNIVGSASATGASYYLYIDPNTKLLDGRANPFYLKPYIGSGEPITQELPYVRDSYRGQGAYIVDFTNSDKWTKWIGKHQFLGYYEERKSKNYSYRFRDVNIVDSPIYAPAGQPKGNQSVSGIAPAPVFPVAPLATRVYNHFYVGDNVGGNVDYGASQFSTGPYAFNWFNPLANGGVGAWVADPAVLAKGGITEGTAGNFAVLNLVKTTGAMWQMYLFDDRLVGTFGKRHDENRNKYQRPPYLKPNGYEFDYAQMDGWIPDNTAPSLDGDPGWALREGDTKTSGVVAKPFRGWGAIDRARARQGVLGFGADLLSGLTVFYNKSDSFVPAAPAISARLEQLPNPSSEGKDYGFTLNLGNKFVLRANKYETRQVNSRAGQSAVFAQRVLRIDIRAFAGNNDAFSLQRQASNWITTANPGFTPAQVESAVANVMGMTVAQVQAYNTSTIAETSDVVSKGNEYEISYNPNNFWTLRANVTRTIAIDANLSPNIPAWIAERTPLWEKIIDPRASAGPGADGVLGTPDDPLGAPWIDTGYTGDLPNTTGGGSARAFLNGSVISPLAITQATEGKPRPQTREWRFNLNTSYRLAGISDNKYLKRMSVGGAVRWEDKAAIGYYGVPVNGSIYAATALDPNRPIYDKAHAYFDGFVTYTTRVYNDKWRARFQLNVRNIQESRAHLQPVGAYPNGVAHTFRIVDPRVFIFTASFDL